MSNKENRELDLPFAMTEGERISPLWIRVSTEIENRLRILRIKNDDTSLSERETAALRGSIRCYRAILGLGDEQPPTG